MSEKPAARTERFSLSRWSRRKLDAQSTTSAVPAAEVSSSAPAAAAAQPAPVAELPSIDSLSFDSDFTAFLKPGVDDKLKRAALKQLFRDPRFNVMDGLDTYIDDYTKADPIPPDVLMDLLQRMSAAISGSGETEQAPQAGSRAEDPAASPPQPSVAVQAPTAAKPALADESAPAPPAAPRSTS